MVNKMPDKLQCITAPEEQQVDVEMEPIMEFKCTSCWCTMPPLFPRPRPVTTLDDNEFRKQEALKRAATVVRGFNKLAVHKNARKLKKLDAAQKKMDEFRQGKVRKYG